MNRVRHYLWIGKLRETRDRALLQRVGVTAMLQLCERVEQPGVETRFLPIEDGVVLDKVTLEAGVGFIRQQVGQGRTVLSACGVGISRSVTFVVAFLKEEEGLTLLEAYRQVVAVHPEARPHPVLWKSLCEAYSEPFSLVDMVKVSRAAVVKP